MPTLLAIDTATEVCSVALISGDETLEKTQYAPRQHAQLVLPMVEAILAESGLKLNALDAIAFSEGPGSFTGIRIGNSVAQGLAFAADLPLIGVPTLQAFAQSAYMKIGAKHVLVALDAYMQDIYWGCYQLSETQLMLPIMEDQICRPSEIRMPNLNASWLGIGDAWQKYEAVLLNESKRDIQILIELFPQASAMLKIAIEKYNHNLTMPVEKAMPVYLRTKDSWKKM